MFNRDNILKSLNAENYYVDKHSLDLFLSDWKIESIYEDENGLEIFDDLALEKIKKGITLKAQGYSDEQIITKLAKIEAKIDKKSESIVDEVKAESNNENSSLTTVIEPQIVETPLANNDKQDVITQGKNFTLDVSSQTLQMLAEAIAKKISDDITNSEIANKLIEAGGYKKDNEVLAKQVQELLEHNKELSKRIEQLESSASKSFWSRFRRG